MTWPYLVSCSGKFDKNAHNFWNSGSNSTKVTFLKSSHQNLSNNIYFVWFLLGPNFPIVFDCLGNDIIMTSFLITRHFQVCIFCRTLDGLSACKISMVQVVFGKFYRQSKKNTMMTLARCHLMLLEFENLKFCKTEYRLSSL